MVQEWLDNDMQVLCLCECACMEESHITHLHALHMTVDDGKMFADRRGLFPHEGLECSKGGKDLCCVCRLLPLERLLELQGPASFLALAPGDDVPERHRSSPFLPPEFTVTDCPSKECPNL